MWRNRMSLSDTFDELRREMDRVFNHYGQGLRSSLATPGAFPALNVWENPESVFVEAELPGVQQEDLQVYAVGNELTIKGQRRPLSGDKFNHLRRERLTGTFTRALTLPCDVNADKVEATLTNGVLTVEMPKAATARPRQITVKAG